MLRYIFIGGSTWTIFVGGMISLVNSFSVWTLNFLSIFLYFQGHFDEYFNMCKQA